VFGGIVGAGRQSSRIVCRRRERDEFWHDVRLDCAYPSAVSLFLLKQRRDQKEKAA
jgi:hypothetical protein